MGTSTENAVANLAISVVFIPIMFVTGLAFCWLPMLGWNNSVAEMFSLPKMNYWQAFWFCQFAGWIIHRPNVSN